MATFQSKKLRITITVIFLTVVFLIALQLLQNGTKIISFGFQKTAVRLTTTNLEVVANPAWPGDYSVRDVASLKTLVYFSAKYNHGRITDVKSPSGNANLVANTPSSGAFYPKIILWPDNDAWSDGELSKLSDFRVTVPKSDGGGYVEWSGVWKDETIGFVNNLTQRIYMVSDYSRNRMLVIHSLATLKATRDISNIRHLYVEFGWHANDYGGVVAQTITGRKVASLVANSGRHFLDGSMINTSGRISNFNTKILDGYVTMYLIRAKGFDGSFLKKVYVRSWDTFNTLDTDITDTMELHLTNPLKTYNQPYPYRLQQGQEVALEYVVVVTDHQFIVANRSLRNFLLFPY